MISITLLTILFVALSVWIDADHINNHQYFKDHTSRACLRIFVLGVIGGNFFGFLLAGSIFYLLFDIGLNYMIGQKWNYIGGNSKTDLFFRKHRKWWFPAKVIILISAILLNILI